MDLNACISGKENVGDTVVVYIGGYRHIGHIVKVNPVTDVQKEVVIQVQEV